MNYLKEGTNPCPWNYDFFAIVLETINRSTRQHPNSSGGLAKLIQNAKQLIGIKGIGQCMKERDLKEAISDRLLLLYLLFRMRKKGYNISGDTKLQKLLYEIEQRMYRNKYKGLNYNFVRWDFGPFSQEVYVDRVDLEKTGFLKRYADKSISISDSGIRLVEMMQKNLKSDKVLEEYFDRVINEFGPYKGKGIKAAIYTSPKVGEKKPIRETTKAEILLRKLDGSEAMKSFWIDDQWFETLRIIFDPTLSLKVRKGLQALKDEEGKPFIPVAE